MYLDHFGLAVNPFGLSPKLEFLYKSGAFEESMAHLIYGVDNSEAIIMITGAIGTGKTMALQSFMANLNQSFQWALVTNTQVTPVELLKLILDDMGVEFPPGCDKSDLLILFKDFLVQTSRSGRRVMIIIDEAQNMAREVLEEIRLLTNLGQGDIQPVQVILVGQPELEALVDRPDLAQLRQRIRVHYRLDPLSRKEVEEYLDHRMAVAGCQRHVFASSAIDRIARFSGGVPRLVNSLAGQGLLSAFVAGRKQVIAGDIEEAEGIAPPVVTSRSAVPGSASAVAPAAPPLPQAAPYIEPHAARRHSSRKRRAPLVVALILVSLVLAIGALYLRGDLQTLREKYWPSKAVPVAVTANQSTVPDTPPTMAMVDSIPVALAEIPASVPDSMSIAVPVEEPAPVSRSQYFVQVASFKTMERALRSCEELKAAGFGTLIKNQQIEDILWRRVLIGPYPDRQAATEGLGRFKHPPEDDYFPISVINPDSGS